ncbi:hypothetical protein ILYODFUR_018249 [Ilyodon furcidens]|uniref:Uncharacterized protein n=1 Tax=Ilyodon furcidens TaxID=33524 RepID=A0ABV0SMK2_9TELE
MQDYDLIKHGVLLTSCVLYDCGPNNLQVKLLPCGCGLIPQPTWKDPAQSYKLRMIHCHFILAAFLNIYTGWCWSPCHPCVDLHRGAWSFVSFDSSLVLFMAVERLERKKFILCIYVL